MKLFEPGRIGKLAIKNRIVMAPMGTGLLEPDGSLLQRAIDYYVARARGGVGLIVTGSVWVSRELEPHTSGNILNSGNFLGGLAELAEGVHDYGTKIAIQLSCGLGRNASIDYIKNLGAVAPSPVPCYNDSKYIARELTTEEIEKLARAFESAAKIIKDAGIDAVEFHAHDGYLFDQFMTAIWNKRTDKYGGDLEGRLTFPLEAIRAVRRGAGANFPLIFRFGLTHYFEGGRSIDEGLEICRRLEAAGVDALSIDAGSYETRYWALPPSTLPKGCMVDLAERVKSVVRIPVMTVGRLGYPELAERVLAEGKADFICLGRPLLADAEWPNKVRENRLEDIRPCIGDFEGCIARILKGKYICCTVNPATGREREFALKPAPKQKKVLIIGGGPSGMEAARVAALRGHKVTLWEKGSVLGGNLLPASVPDFKVDYKLLTDYLSAQIKKVGVTIKLNKEATPELVQRVKPDVIFIAIGGIPTVPKIPGIQREKVITAIDLFLGKKCAGESVVVVGGGMIGCETALYLAQHGKKVAIVEILDTVVPDLFVAGRMHLLKLLAENNARILNSTRVLEITDEGVVIADKDGRISPLEADTVVIATGLEPHDTLSKNLEDKVPEVYTIGDCVQTRKVQQAIWEGFRLARLI